MPSPKLLCVHFTIKSGKCTGALFHTSFVSLPAHTVLQKRKVLKIGSCLFCGGETGLHLTKAHKATKEQSKVVVEDDDDDDDDNNYSKQLYVRGTKYFTIYYLILSSSPRSQI